MKFLMMTYMRGLGKMGEKIPITLGNLVIHKVIEVI